MNHPISIPITEPNQGILNFSHLLDAPAGKHGFTCVKDGHLYFEDGTRARFLGFNIAARSNTPSHEDAERLAERLASLGVNVIRMHAADAPIGEDKPGSWSASSKTPLIDYDKKTSRFFNPEGLDRFDYLAAKLKEKGIYIHVDLLVARAFLPEDDLDYPGGVPSCMKRFSMYNERLIELQKEYAKAYLTHVNPYTGLAPADDPSIMTVQMNNEESAIKGNVGSDAGDEMAPYREEVQKRFNDYLLMKYYTRKRLAEAWTLDGVCALGDEEDPEAGTVRGIEGGFYQSVNEPMGSWDAPENAARYADFMEFGTYMNHRFYRDMKDYLISIGVKVPIVASNLVTGAADVYGHTVGDIMENNTYFNHPIMPVQNDTYMVYGPTEYVSVNPLRVQMGVGSMGTTLLSLASVAIVGGKPFMTSEWNEYGLHPFHSTAYVHTVAYACLNDWDGLILYNHHTSESLDAEPADEIVTVFDAYNDPALIAQWGFMASIFLKGLVSTAKHRVDVVYTASDRLTLPNFHAMPMCFFPYITGMRNVFLDADEHYRGDADIAVNAGFLNSCDLRDAAHAVSYAWSPYRDPKRRYLDKNRLVRAAKGSIKTQPGVHISEHDLVFDRIAEIAGTGDYTAFASIMDEAMKAWGVMDPACGYVDGTLISDTGELRFDPDHQKFQITNSKCGYFSGAPAEPVQLSEDICVLSENERITLALLPTDAEALSNAQTFLLTALGKTGTDAASYTPGPELMPGLRFTAVRLDGKLYAESLSGSITVRAKEAKLELLDPQSRLLQTIPGTQDQEHASDSWTFPLDGSQAGIQYRLTVTR